MSRLSDSLHAIRFLLPGALVFAGLLMGCSPADTDTSTEPAAPAAETTESAETPDPGTTTDETTTDTAVATRTAEPRPWPHEDSDIPVDDRIHFGHLPNGMRWAWADNSEPKERVYLRLHVDAGSLAEEDDELGMAHFLEHMAFNGSRNFPPGHLIAWFQKHGMAFGADTNAHTAFSETVYKLDLPTNDVQSIRDGLMVLRDFADGMTIAEEDVQGEKGVIDGEQRERDSAQMRVMMKLLDVAFDGTRLEHRLPIGTKEVRDTFNAEKVRAFYERWYRPEHMTLVAVGDLGDMDPSELFAEFFADMPVPEAPLEMEPGPGDPTSVGQFYSIHEPEIPTVSISFGRTRRWEPEAVSIENWVKDIPLRYAYSMLNLRYAELAKKEEAKFLSASGSTSSVFEVFEGEGVSVDSTPENWKAALAAGEQELRRALEHGFQQAELDQLKADALRGLDEAVEREQTASSRALVRRILQAAEEPTVPTRAATRRDVLKPVIEGLTVEACHEALKQAWSVGELSITTTGNLDLGDDAEAQLRAAYEASTAVKVEALEEKTTDAFAYASKATDAGKIADRAHVEDLDFHTVRFENGVLLNLKRTDFREKSIGMSVEFGEGELTLAADKHNTVGQLAGAVMNSSGLGKHTVEDLRRLTAGKQVGVGFGIGNDRFSLSGGTTAEDLLFQCELACAYLTDPGYREESLVQVRRQLPLMYMQMQFTHAGPLQSQFLPALMHDDPRHAFPSQEQVAAVTAEDVKAWMDPILAGAPIEITLVGDLDVEESIAAVARTFGALPKRRDWKPYTEARTSPAPKAGFRETYEIQTQVPKSLVLMVFPTNDGIDITRRRGLNMLDRVVADRLLVEVREKLGAAYSPGSAAQTSTLYPGVGMQMIQAMADPEKVDTLVEACLVVADDLATKGVTDEELGRLREPVLKKRRDAKRTNGYWLAGIGRAQSEPDRLDHLRNGDDWYENVTAADLSKLAKQYLSRKRASIAVVSPAK